MYNLIPQRDLMGICDQIAREITPPGDGRPPPAGQHRPRRGVLHRVDPL